MYATTFPLNVWLVIGPERDPDVSWNWSDVSWFVCKYHWNFKMLFLYSSLDLKINNFFLSFEFFLSLERINDDEIIISIYIDLRKVKKHCSNLYSVTYIQCSLINSFDCEIIYKLLLYTLNHYCWSSLFKFEVQI